MFGYVLPRRDRLSEEAQVRYHAAYCGLCRALKLEYGFAARFLVNYDMTFLYFLLREGDPACPERCFCPARPWCRKACLPEDGAMRYAADLSVLLSWWKLLDARRDSRGPRRLAAKAALLLYRRSYRRASARHPALDAAFGTELARLQALEDEKSPSIDRTADAFASLLRDCAAHYDGRERRPEQLLLYHVGRYLYLADALEDLPRDVRAGAYNPLRYRYGADGGTLDPADRAQLLETIDASISMACSAMELLDGRRDRELLSNILYFGLPAVLHAVAEGTFRKAGKRRKT